MKMTRIVSPFIISAALVGCTGVNPLAIGHAHALREPRPLGSYHSVVIDPVAFQPAATARLKPAEQSELSKALGRRASAAFAPRYAIATEPASGVLRLRVSVDEIKPSSRVANLLTAAVLFVPLDMGGIAAHLIVEDSVSGERIASLADRRQGSPLGRGGFFASFKPTGHAQAGFEQLLQDLLSLLSKPATETTQTQEGALPSPQSLP